MWFLKQILGLNHLAITNNIKLKVIRKYIWKTFFKVKLLMYMYEKNWNEFLVREVTGGTTQLILSAYVAADYNLVYSSPKMFLLIFSLILSLIPGLKPSFSTHISVSFCLLLLDLGSCRIGILPSPLPRLKILFFNFDSQLMLTYTRGI